MGKMAEIYDHYREVILYVFWGVFTTAISLLSYALFVRVFGIDPTISNILSWFCGVIFAFVTNKWLVFRSRSTDLKTIIWELGSFFSSRIFTGVIAAVLFPFLNYTLGLGTIDVDFGILNIILGTSGMISRIITSIVEIVLNWVLSKYLVFKGNKNKTEQETE